MAYFQVKQHDSIFRGKKMGIFSFEEMSLGKKFVKPFVRLGFSLIHNHCGLQ